MIGTSDQSCWLAEACKILLLLLLLAYCWQALPAVASQIGTLTPLENGVVEVCRSPRKPNWSGGRPSDRCRHRQG